MAKLAIFFVTESLISSEKQINFIDKKFDSEHGGQIGSKISSLARNVKSYFDSANLSEDPDFILFKEISKICRKSNFSPFFNFLADFFHCFFDYLKSQYSSNLNKQKNRPPFQDENNYDNVDKSEDSSDDDCIMIETEPDLRNKRICKDHSQLEYMGGWKYFVEYISSISKDKDDEYNYNLIRGLVQCITIGIEELEENTLNNVNEMASFTTFTNSIESLAGKEMDFLLRINERNLDGSAILSQDGDVNPVVQILATSLRSILEAIKLKR